METVFEDNFLRNEEIKKVEGRNIEIDPENGFRFEWRDIGMVKNSKKENLKKEKVYLDPAPHVVKNQTVKLRGWYKSKFEPKGVRSRPCFTDALLTQPYGGTCPVKCAFCYINNGVRGYRGNNITVVDPKYPEKIDKQLSKMKFGFPMYISSFTESFQKLEDYYGNTKRLTEVALKHGLPIFYLTRQIPPVWAIEALAENKYSYQQFSIITSNRKDYRKLSPGAASLDYLLESIKLISDYGIYISIQINPIILGIVSDEDILKLLEELSDAGANHVIFKFVEIVSPSVKPLLDKLGRLFPDRITKFEELFSETIGGLRTIREEIRKKSLNLYSKKVYELGMTMGLCYEYEYEKDDKGKVVDKTGVSMGKKYTTAAQCHGQRTPMFLKNEETGKFEPFESCPPSGCLYCSDYHKEPPCGSDILFQAKALNPADYNKF